MYTLPNTGSSGHFQKKSLCQRMHTVVLDFCVENPGVHAFLLRFVSPFSALRTDLVFIDRMLEFQPVDFSTAKTAYFDQSESDLEVMCGWRPF